MAFTRDVATVFRGVRDLSMFFDKRTTPDAVLLRAYNRYQAQLIAKIPDFKRDSMIQDSTTVSLSGYSFSADESGAVLPEATEFLGGDVIFSDSNREPENLRLLPYAQRNAPFFRWGAWIQIPTVQSGIRSPYLKLLGVEADWTGVQEIEVHYYQRLLIGLSTLSSQFELPGDCEDVLVAWGAYLCARRAAEEGNPVDVASFERDWLRSEELYLDQVTGRRRAQIGRATEDW